MKLIVGLALVAFAAAVPVQKTIIIKPNYVQIIKDIPSEGVHFKFQYGTRERREYQSVDEEDDAYQIAQYITYLFRQSRKLDHSPLEFAQYLSENGFPEDVVKYLAEEYETGLSEPYFQAPYELFRYYSTREYSPELQKYLLGNIEISVSGELHDNPRYAEVPRPIIEYAIEQAKYFNQGGFTSEQAQRVNQALIQAQKYAKNALQYFASARLPPQVYQHIYEQLEQGVDSVEKAIRVYQTYVSTSRKYVPYYAAQYYIEQVNQAYQYFQDVYSYIRQQELPKYFVEQVRYAYLAAQNAYQLSRFRQEVYPGFKYQSDHSSVYELTKNILDEFRQYVAKGDVPQEYAYYIIEQLEYVLQDTYNVERPSQYVVQRVYQYYQNIMKYVQQEGRIPDYISKFFFERIELVFQHLKGYYQQYYYPEETAEKYFSDEYQYGPYISQQYQKYLNYPTQYKGETQMYQNGPYSEGYMEYFTKPTQYDFYKGESEKYQDEPFSQQYEIYLNNPSKYNLYKDEVQEYPYQYQYGQYDTFPSAA